MKLEEFNECMIYLGIAYNKEFTQNEIRVYYDFLKKYDVNTFKRAIKKIIEKSSYIPKIADLINECEENKDKTKFEVLNYMRKVGYFKLCAYGEIDDVKASRNFDKATRFLERGIIPDWFEEDLNYYYKKMHQEQLEHKNKNLLA